MYDRCPLSADQSATAQNILLCVQHGGRTDRKPVAHIGGTVRVSLDRCRLHGVRSEVVALGFGCRPAVPERPILGRLETAPASRANLSRKPVPK